MPSFPPAGSPDPDRDLPGLGPEEMAAPPTAAAGGRVGVDVLAARPTFPIALRGYDRAAVDAYLAAVDEAVGALRATKSPEAAIRRAIDQVGEQTSTILQQAHDAAAELTERSTAEAEERLGAAHREASELRRDAERDAADLRRDAEARVRALDADNDALWQERQRLLADVQRIAQELEGVVVIAAQRFPPDESGEEHRAGAGDAELLADAPFDVEDGPTFEPDPTDAGGFAGHDDRALLDSHVRHDGLEDQPTVEAPALAMSDDEGLPSGVRGVGPADGFGGRR